MLTMVGDFLTPVGDSLCLMLVYPMYYINSVSLYSVILQFNLVTLVHYGKLINKYVTVIPFQELQYYKRAELTPWRHDVPPGSSMGLSKSQLLGGPN